MNYLSPLYVTNGTNTLTLNSAAPSITSNTSFAIGSNGGTQLTFNSAGTTITSTAELLLPASTTSIASLNIPSTGVAPTSPAYGDIWVTNTGPYIKIAANNVIPTFTASSFNQSFALGRDVVPWMLTTSSGSTVAYWANIASITLSATPFGTLGFDVSISNNGANVATGRVSIVYAGTQATPTISAINYISYTGVTTYATHFAVTNVTSSGVINIWFQCIATGDVLAISPAKFISGSSSDTILWANPANNPASYATQTLSGSNFATVSTQRYWTAADHNNTFVSASGVANTWGSNGTTLITGSTSGTLTFAVVPTFPSTTANTVFATPNGSAGSPSFRTLYAADLSNSVIATTTTALTLGGNNTTQLTFSTAGAVTIAASAAQALTMGIATTAPSAFVVSTAGAISILAPSGQGLDIGVGGTTGVVTVATGSIAGAIAVTSTGVTHTGTVTATEFLVGTLSYTAANPLELLAGAATGYVQSVVQNKTAGTGNSADYIVNNDSGTDTTFYGDFGMNSSTFTGSGSFNLPNAVYLTSTSGDLSIGSTTANAVHLLVNSNSADLITLGSTGAVAITAYSGQNTTIGAGGTAALLTVATTGITSTVQLYDTNTGVTYSNYIAVAAMSTANLTLSGTQTVDGVALIVGNLCAALGQTTGSASGVYVVASGSWTRATGFATPAQIQSKDIYATAGTTHQGTWWMCTTAGAVTVGTTSLTFVQLGVSGGLTTVTNDATSRSANTVYSAPNGSAGTATFRSLVYADISGALTAPTSTALTLGAGGTASVVSIASGSTASTLLITSTSVTFGVPVVTSAANAYIGPNAAGRTDNAYPTTTSTIYLDAVNTISSAGNVEIMELRCNLGVNSGGSRTVIKAGTGTEILLGNTDIIFYGTTSGIAGAAVTASSILDMSLTSATFGVPVTINGGAVLQGYSWSKVTVSATSYLALCTLGNAASGSSAEPDQAHIELAGGPWIGSSMGTLIADMYGPQGGFNVTSSVKGSVSGLDAYAYLAVYTDGAASPTYTVYLVLTTAGYTTTAVTGWYSNKYLSNGAIQPLAATGSFSTTAPGGTLAWSSAANPASGTYTFPGVVLTTTATTFNVPVTMNYSLTTASGTLSSTAVTINTPTVLNGTLTVNASSTSQNITPITGSTYALGSSLHTWSNVWADAINVGNTITTSELAFTRTSTSATTIDVTGSSVICYTGGTTNISITGGIANQIIHMYASGNGATPVVITYYNYGGGIELASIGYNCGGGITFLCTSPGLFMTV